MDYLAFYAQTYPQIYTLAIAKRGVCASVVKRNVRLRYNYNLPGSNVNISEKIFSPKNP